MFDPGLYLSQRRHNVNGFGNTNWLVVTRIENCVIIIAVCGLEMFSTTRNFGNNIHSTYSLLDSL